MSRRRRFQKRLRRWFIRQRLRVQGEHSLSDVMWLMLDRTNRTGESVLVKLPLKQGGR